MGSFFGGIASSTREAVPTDLTKVSGLSGRPGQCGKLGCRSGRREPLTSRAQEKSSTIEKLKSLDWHMLAPLCKIVGVSY